jgi:hypothetical protein
MYGDNFTTWRKASYSNANGSCVEVAATQYGIGIRDTAQHGSGPVLQFPIAVWQTFIGAAKYKPAGHIS